MESFSEIFQAMVQDHGQRPRNFGRLEAFTHHAEGVNPLTGDRIEVYFQVSEADVINAARFSGKLSSLAATSASVMIPQLIGLARQEAQKLIVETLKRISGEQPVPEELPESEYTVLLEIRNFPHRVRCASLAWNTAATALASD
ncbi:MAG: iron-sulfur cluster assembly scaffold protein [Verrucomicrobiales bacterium]|nr:iron-sulfur cluster assembly scaffold protein [Verrucomicrobiales bacterium]